MAKQDCKCQEMLYVKASEKQRTRGEKGSECQDITEVAQGLCSPAMLVNLKNI